MSGNPYAVSGTSDHDASNDQANWWQLPETDPRDDPLSVVDVTVDLGNGPQPAVLGPELASVPSGARDVVAWIAERDSEARAGAALSVERDRGDLRPTVRAAIESVLGPLID